MRQVRGRQLLRNLWWSAINRGGVKERPDFDFFLEKNGRCCTYVLTYDQAIFFVMYIYRLCSSLSLLVAQNMLTKLCYALIVPVWSVQSGEVSTCGQGVVRYKTRRWIKTLFTLHPPTLLLPMCECGQSFSLQSRRRRRRRLDPPPPPPFRIISASGLDS